MASPSAGIRRQLWDNSWSIARRCVSYVKLTELFKKVTWGSPMVRMLGFLMCFVGMYVLTSLFLSVGDAENLSLLTSDTNGVAWADVQSTVEIKYGSHLRKMSFPGTQAHRNSRGDENSSFQGWSNKERAKFCTRRRELQT